ncbi:ABC transporter ATP-binding protein [Aliidiomarina shirensis]|uniref:ABC transporter ATP-binding protein n=1 Tax=Aliidiomarina shirensis TaxID=1048642 RepID=A0A432WT43_9GAMM|nr:ABC transporter ATP-binding protein [Aliidiomarina shirensis]RUO36908.1 ABC transporter ATP-binding protein [Aliidiomarina shirensis]
MNANKNEVRLHIQSLSKCYGTKYALNNVSLRANAGEVIAVLGKNGAGKTSLINSILGMHNYQAESVEILGTTFHDRHRPTSIRQRIGVMMQLGTLNANLTVAEQLDLFCSYYQNGATAAELINEFELSPIANQRFGKLSGGQRQQVLFAISVAGNPSLLFLDEPTVGMDVEARHILWQQIQQRRAQGCAILLTTHYIEEAQRLADRVAILRAGQIIAEGTVSEIIADHESLEAAYLHLIQEPAHV